MGEGFLQRNKTEKLTVTALMTALFAVTALAFKGFVIIPSITELRPVNALPLIFGLLFGNLGAIASALGNLFGDAVGGTLTFASLGGMIGNFAMAYIPYKVWGALLCKRDENILLLDSAKNYLWYFILALLSAIPAAVIIPLFTDFFGFVSYNILFGIIFANNFLVECTIGVVLYGFFSRACLKGKLSAVRAMVFSLDNVRGKRMAALVLTVNTFLAFGLSVFFFFNYSNEIGQLAILVPMAILAAMMLLSMVK